MTYEAQSHRKINWHSQALQVHHRLCVPCLVRCECSYRLLYIATQSLNTNTNTGWSIATQGLIETLIYGLPHCNAKFKIHAHTGCSTTMQGPMHIWYRLQKICNINTANPIQLFMQAAPWQRNNPWQWAPCSNASTGKGLMLTQAAPSQCTTDSALPPCYSAATEFNWLCAPSLYSAATASNWLCTLSLHRAATESNWLCTLSL